MESLIVIGIIVAIMLAIIIPISIRQNKFKKTIIADTIKKTFPNAEFDPTGHITKGEYDSIGCLRRGSHYRGNDLLKAKTEAGTPFQFSEIYTYDHINKSDVTVFRGGVFSFKYPKKFAERVYLCSKHGWGKGAFKSEFTKTHRTETENEEFNDTYYLYAEDEQTAFYLCTPKIMEQLIKLKKDQKNAVIISFRDHWMHVAIPNLNLFKAPVFGIKNKKKIDIFINKTKEDLKHFTDIIDMFDLDSRLFTSDE